MAVLKFFAPRGFHARVSPAPFLTLAALSQAGASFVQQGIVVMGVFFASHYRLTLAQMGLVTTALSLGITSSMVVMGAASDRMGPRRLLFYGAIGMSGLSLALLRQSRFGMLLLILFGLGVMLAIAAAAGTKAVFTAFRDRPRGTVMGIRQTGVPLGALLAASVLPRMASGSHGLQPTFWLFAIEVLLLGWAFSGVMQSGIEEAAIKRPRINLSVVSQIWRPALVSTLMVSGQYLLLGFSLTDLHQTHGISLVTGGLILALAQLGGGAGRILTGFVSDRLGGRRPPVIVGCAFIAALMALVVAAMPARVSIVWLALVWFFFGVGAVGWNALTITWAGESVPSQHSGFAMSAVGTCAFLGSAIFPPLFGALVDATHQFNLGWALLGIFLAAVGVMTWRFGRTAAKVSKA